MDNTSSCDLVFLSMNIIFYSLSPKCLLEVVSNTFELILFISSTFVYQGFLSILVVSHNLTGLVGSYFHVSNN